MKNEWGVSLIPIFSVQSVERSRTQRRREWWISLLMAALGVLLLVESAFADAIIGKLRNSGPQKPLEVILMNTTQAVTIDTSPELLAYLRRLSTGDSISGQGRLSNDGRKVFLDSIERVGLQEILGAWRGSSREIFEFQTYDRLNVYIPTATYNGSVMLTQTRSLQYVLTPERENRFSIFMTDQDGRVRLAFLQLEQKKIELWLTDFESGQLTEKISLSPFYIR